MTKTERDQYTKDLHEVSASRCLIIADRLAFLAISRKLPQKELTKLFELELKSMLLPSLTTNLYNFTDG